MNVEGLLAEAGFEHTMLGWRIPDAMTKRQAYLPAHPDAAPHYARLLVGRSLENATPERARMLQDWLRRAGDP